jgi:hypothetical protein
MDSVDGGLQRHGVKGQGAHPEVILAARSGLWFGLIFRFLRLLFALFRKHYRQTLRGLAYKTKRQPDRVRLACAGGGVQPTRAHGSRPFWNLARCALSEPAVSPCLASDLALVFMRLASAE